ncbi:hypothetical protein F5Y19DRAFT_425090 [Xylariaceae sp. FL1651]|nr:hypothetical protein F5Y19DRAFT_425090 [Xylariaceae sp. FL1651]
MVLPTSVTRPAEGSTTSAVRNTSIYKGPVGPLRHRCPLCPAAGTQLLVCAGCRAFRYCSSEHQVAHWPQHKSVCTKIKNARARLAKEDHDVRNATPDFMTPANAFETGVGRFWDIFSTREYMRARFALGRQMLALGTLDGVHEALEHMRDMLRLCRSDNMGLRNTVPAVMLRLDLDQECYDFIKWWATCDPDGTYNWGDMTLPYLNINGADVFEDPGFLLGKYPELDFVVALLLLKLKLLVDVRNLKITRKILAQRRLPAELRDQIERDVLRSPLSTKLQREPQESLIKAEEKLVTHIRRLGTALVEANGNFMFHLFEPDKALSTNVIAYLPGSWDEMALAMQHSYATWWETEGVLDLLNDARACAARDSENEIEDQMEIERTKHGRTAEKLLADMSINRIWGYLDYAVENASYLGPWSERPSERHTREKRKSSAKAIADELEFKEFSDDGAWSSDED